MIDVGKGQLNATSGRGNGRISVKLESQDGSEPVAKREYTVLWLFGVKATTLH